MRGLAALGFPNGAESGAGNRNPINMERGRMLVNELVTIFLCQPKALVKLIRII